MLPNTMYKTSFFKTVVWHSSCTIFHLQEKDSGQVVDIAYRVFTAGKKIRILSDVDLSCSSLLRTRLVQTLFNVFPWLCNSRVYEKSVALKVHVRTCALDAIS